MTEDLQTEQLVSVSAETPETPPSELRTFLFADVRGYTRFTQERGDEAAAALVARFAALTRDVVRRRGGEVVELRGDEALAVFNSARQALRAAVDLQARYERESETDPSLPLPVGIGLDTGEAVPFEGGYRGDALNLASRLCNLAGPGEILTTEGLVYLARHVQGVSYAPAVPVPLKGFANDVPVIRVLRTAASPRTGPVQDGQGSLEISRARIEPPLPIGGFLGALPSGALVGREKEWGQIMERLEAVMQGTGQLVLLSGEPGIGKTRLAQEVTLKARHWGFLVATGRCYEQEQGVPYYPFLEALVTLYEACSPAVRLEIPRRWPHLSRLLPEQIGLLPVVSEGQEDQHLLFRAVTGFIEAIAQSIPVALLLDDLHWADDSSLKLLQYLARYTRGHRVFLLGTYRDVEVHRQHPLETALIDLDREQLVTEVVIRRLDQEGTAALLAEIMGAKEDLPDLADLVYRRTDGNAFFVQEMLRALVERGDLYREDGHWARRKVLEMEVPKSIRSVIGQRLSHLENQAQEILREASVLGQEFAFDDLLALGRLAPEPRPGHSPFRALEGRTAGQSGWTEDEIEGALEQAMTAGLVREISPDTYVFNHALTQQTLYAELSTRRRKRLHLAAGHALERLSQRERERRAGELARHYLEGDDVDKALQYALVAGDQAEKVFANREAERQYRTALELAREQCERDREVEALEKLATILTIGARYDEALEMLEQAAELYRATGDREQEASAVAQIGHVHQHRRAREQGIARLEPLVEAMETERKRQTDPPPSPGLAALWESLGHLYVNSGNYEKQLEAADKAIELSRPLQDRPEGVRLLLGAEVTRADALAGLGQLDDALKIVEDIIPRAEAAGDLTNLARALGNAAEYYARRGDFDRDRRYLERMLAVSELRGDRGQILVGSMALSTNAFAVGDWGRSLQHLERAEAIIRSLGTPRWSIWPITSRGWLALRQGNLEQASRYAREALPLAEQLGEIWWWRLAARLQAEIDLQAGQAATGLADLEPLLGHSGWQEDLGFVRALARLHLELGHDAEAADLISAAVGLISQENDPPEVVETLVVLGTVYARQGRWERA
ncbi:MAG: AAA family ATPase, partial [Chloroflexi bacterium]|nr:AAA family ATPase [Chloroflexota bacterium]